jgi:hypothetical protein
MPACISLPAQSPSYIGSKSCAPRISSCTTMTYSLLFSSLRVRHRSPPSPGRDPLDDHWSPRCPHLSTPRLPLFLVPCSSSFPVQGDDFYLLTPVIATLATSQQFTVQPSLVPILCPRYSPSSLCQILSFDVNQPETGVDRSVLTPTNSSVLIKRTVQSQTATTLCLRKRRLDVLDQVVMRWYVFITIGICTQT